MGLSGVVSATSDGLFAKNSICDAGLVVFGGFLVIHLAFLASCSAAAGICVGTPSHKVMQSSPLKVAQGRATFRARRLHKVRPERYVRLTVPRASSEDSARVTCFAAWHRYYADDLTTCVHAIACVLATAYVHDPTILHVIAWCALV